MLPRAVTRVGLLATFDSPSFEDYMVLIIEITVFIVFLVVFKFFVLVSEVVSIFSKLSSRFFGEKDTFFHPPQLLGGTPGLPSKSTPLVHIK